MPPRAVVIPFGVPEDGRGLGRRAGCLVGEEEGDVSKRAVYPIIVVVALAALLAAGLTKTSAEPRAVAQFVKPSRQHESAGFHVSQRPYFSHR